ncbi:MAG TPA: hypothetical protein VHB30_12190 [Solirubrobacteraceae bacterium]|jgi:hypothetical protein|nr:hypothetical protein [Solirubrobacteraceae bacterium]
MAAWEIILIVVVAVVALLFLGGYLGNARARTARARRLDEHIAKADRALATARAGDRGWDRDVLESTVRETLAVRRPGQAIERLELIQVIDLPGTDSDSAVFLVVCGEREERMELVRTGDRWAAV